MEDKYIISAFIVVAIIAAIFVFRSLNVSFFGLKLKGENGIRRNKLDIDGKHNKVKMGSNANKTPADNTAKVRGEDHDVEMM